MISASSLLWDEEDTKIFCGPRTLRRGAGGEACGDGRGDVEGEISLDGVSDTLRWELGDPRLRRGSRGEVSVRPSLSVTPKGVIGPGSVDVSAAASPPSRDLYGPAATVAVSWGSPSDCYGRKRYRMSV